MGILIDQYRSITGNTESELSTLILFNALKGIEMNETFKLIRIINA